MNDAPPRRLTRLDLSALGVNAIVGSSIFLMPGLLAALMGPASLLAHAATALLLAPIALCFAEAASTRDRPGGPALYAHESFGPFAGYAIGWLCWVTEIVSYAAVASGLGAYAAPFWAGADKPAASKLLAAAAIAATAAVNMRGAKPGARVSTAFTLAKLVPLVAIACAGLPLAFTRGLGAPVAHPLSALPRACFLAYFAFQGFEVVPVPAGEAVSPQRDVPFAVITALGLSAFLYMGVQAAALAATPNLAGSTRPLADAGLALFGPAGEKLVAAGALTSMLGFVAGCALGGPRYLVALADEGHLPAAFGRSSPRTGAPIVAVGVTAVLAALAALALNFEKLVDFANVVIGAQYLATCASVLVSRRRGIPAGFRAPGGAAIPVAGMLATLFLGAQGGWMQLVAVAVVLAIGLVLKSLARSAA